MAEAPGVARPAADPPLARIAAPSWRIVPSRFPPVSLFDHVADPADLDIVFALEAMTNPRVRDELGEIALVAAADRVTGPGSTPVMAAFTHLNPMGARFTTPWFGAWYAGLELDTAIAETRHHRELFLRATDQGEIDIDMRVYIAEVDTDLHDVRGGGARWPGLYDPDSHAAGQALGARLRDTGSNGFVYDSVRRAGGSCVALYRPRLVQSCRQERHLTYRFDGTRISEIYEKRAFGG